jgi:hypothetical protein
MSDEPSIGELAEGVRAVAERCARDRDFARRQRIRPSYQSLRAARAAAADGTLGPWLRGAAERLLGDAYGWEVVETEEGQPLLIISNPPAADAAPVLER